MATSSETEEAITKVEVTILPHFSQAMILHVTRPRRLNSKCHVFHGETF